MSARASNYNEFEKNLLMEIVKDYPIVFSKQRDGQCLKQKDQAWVAITKKYNENAEVLHRSADSLKLCVTNLTAKAKKDDCNRRKDLFKTGGGPPPAELSSSSAMVVDLMPQVFSSLDVEDDDHITHAGRSI
jgi:hypothetical protein